jgi:hypothetical protein
MKRNVSVCRICQSSVPRLTKEGFCRTCRSQYPVVYPITGNHDFKNLTSEQLAMIQQTAGADGLRALANGAQASQESALQAFDQSLTAPWHPFGPLAEAARTAESDECRLEIAQIAREVGQQGLEHGRTIERMNENNNSFWRTAAILTGVAALATVAIAVFIFTGDVDGVD